MYHTKRPAAFLTALMLTVLSGCGTVPIEPADNQIAEESLATTTEQTTTGTASTAQTQTTPEIMTTSDAETTAISQTKQTAGTQNVQTTAKITSGNTASSTTQTTAAAVDPSTPVDLNALLDSMTLQEKAAQMMLVGCSDVASAQKAAAGGAGGLCLFAAPFSGKSKAQVREMTAQFQSKADIPLLISVDEEGGKINRISLNAQLRSVPFRSGSALFAEGGWEQIIRDTKEKAELLLDLGVNVNLAPVCDVPLDKSNYIYARCFSMDATETAEYIRVVVTEMKADRLGSTLKHFPGYGGSVDTHKSMSYDSRDYSAFTDGDFLPFIAGIEAGADAVMVSHNIVNCMDAEHPASLSPAVHTILRDTLGFSGVIITDDLGMNAITDFSGGQNPAVAAVLAGNDLICYAKFDEAVTAIVNAVQDGSISETQINASVLRILRWKRSLGIL